MDRNRDRGWLGNLFEIASMLPWWLEAGLAMAAYIVFHSLATADFEVVNGPAQIGAIAWGHPWKTIALFLQVLLPLVLLFGALASENSRHRSEARDDEAAGPARAEAAKPLPAAGAPLCPHCGKAIGARVAGPGPRAG
jgi:hypothetical protein